MENIYKTLQYELKRMLRMYEIYQESTDGFPNTIHNKQ